jgi:streptogramin lyase
MCRGSANAVKISHETGEVLFIVPLEGVPRAVAIDAQGHIWIGCGMDGEGDDPMWKLDEATGACVFGNGPGCQRPAVPVADWPYGAAVDQRGYLWVLSNHHWSDGTLTKIDTTTGEEIGRYKRTDGGCAKFYGIAIDQLGDIWTGNAQCDDVLKFKGETGKFIGGYMSGGEVTRGVAVDLDGNVWVANSGTSTVTKIHGHTGDILETLNTGSHPIGIGVDAYGHVWAVNRSANNVYKINGITLDPTPIGVGDGPYTYSDMLGTLLRTITLNNDGTGYWTVNYDTGVDHPVWDEVRWTAEEPGGSEITLRTRCADNEADLYTALWSDVIAEPGPNPCDNERWIQVEVKFQADNLNSAPILDDVTIIWEG